LVLIDASEFGLMGDGVTDNSPGLRKLRDEIRGLEDGHAVVDFEPGHYLYTDNTWWNFGERSVTLRFNGARVENTSTEAWDRGWGLLPTSNNPHEFAADGAPFNPDAATVPAGARFHSVAASAQVIDLFTPLPLVPGEIVLLTGCIQQIREVDGVKEGWGWPPNFRFYEYKTVAAVDGTKIRFTERLRHAYDENWPDWEQTPLAGHTNPYGAARLFLTHGAGWRQLRSLRVYGAVFVANRNKQYTPLSFTGRKFELIGCRTEGEVMTSMSHAEVFEARDCDFGPVEMDKINRDVRFDHCIFRGALTGMGAGVESLCLRDCDIMGDANGRGLGIAPRIVRLEGTVRVHGQTIFQNAPTVSVPGPVLLSGTIAR
jgi:hypothetical protein